MRTRRLGKEGPDVSVVGLGCNNFGGRVDLEGTRAVVDAALDAGVTLFDTADIYGNQGGSESFLGEALEGRRDRVLLATKFGGDMGDGTKARGSREYIRKAVEGSLQRLRTDVIDLYQYHTPDGITPFEETFGALDELVREGKVRYVGHSNLKAAQVEEVDAFCREQGFARPVSAQNQYSLMRREAEEELLPTCERLGIGVLPYFPLASGLLTGKYSRGAAPGRDAPLGARRGLHGRDLRSPRSARGVCARAWRDAVERCDRRPPRANRRSRPSSPARRSPSRSARTWKQPNGSRRRKTWRRFNALR